MTTTDYPADPTSIKDAAKRLGVAPKTLRSWVRTGKIPAWRLPGKGRWVVSLAGVLSLAKPVEPTCRPHTEPVLAKGTRATLKRWGLEKYVS